jgi:hypothetical protein
MEDGMPWWELDHGWAALAVPCARCGAPRGTLCVDGASYRDATGEYATVVSRRDPHDERVADWESRMQDVERRMGWRP